MQKRVFIHSFDMHMTMVMRLDFAYFGDPSSHHEGNGMGWMGSMVDSRGRCLAASTNRDGDVGV